MPKNLLPKNLLPKNLLPKNLLPKNLLIVESPAKAKTIKKYLGNDFIVLASYGHVRDLLPKNGAVDPAHNFAMHYVDITKNAKHIKELLAALKKTQVLYLATDPDREGEAIAWHIVNICHEHQLLQHKTYHRVVFHEITKTAIIQAIAAPRTITMSLVNAQQARRALDYLVGFNLSPLLWQKIRRGLSAGRVQSPALRMIVEREQEIESFVSAEYWDITAQLSTDDTSFTAKLASYLGVKQTQFAITASEPAHAVRNHIISAAAGHLTVTDVSNKQRKRKPAPPFITSTIQQEAARKLGFTAARTMRIAQQLYEGIDTDKGLLGLITYMRTDSVNLAASAVHEIRTLINSHYGAEYLPAKSNIYKAKAKNAQEAHEAIRPTTIALTPPSLQQYLTTEQFKLYQLIWQRTVACQMIPATIDSVIAELSAYEHSKVIATFKATGSVVAHYGFMVVYGKPVKDDGDQSTMLPPLQVGSVITLNDLQTQQHFTEPPPRYSEASLIKELEECGIGRPSTYASIISTLEQRNYVTNLNKQFRPTDIGRVVSRFLTEHFKHYVDYNFTADLEDDLDAIARGEQEWLPLLHKFWSPFSQHIEHIGATVTRSQVTHELLEEPCPKCGQALAMILGRNNRFIGCTSHPNCDYTRSISSDQAQEHSAEPAAACPQCDGELKLKHGPYGQFWGCSNYPNCSYIKNSNLSVDTGIPCPICQAGNMIQRRSKRGKIFFSCKCYPKCKYAIWNQPIAVPCPQCAWPILTVKITKKRGEEHVCPQEQCKFSKAAAQDH